jgi:Domain of unknown function (DUF6457)
VNEWLATRAAALGVDGLTPDEIALLLSLAGDAAHESGARTNAPLLCYLVGRAHGSDTGGRSLADLAEIVRSTS